MKKYKSIIFGFILGAVITGSLAVAAITLTAKEVTYTPNNSNWKVNNTKDAIDYLYKLADYEVPADTYFYDNTTKGRDIQRYKKIKGKYYKCDEYGNVIDKNKPVEIDSTKLIEYKAEVVDNINAGRAGYANKNFLLGNGLDILNAENEGYVKGYADGKKDSNTGNGEIVYKRHHHTGSPKTGGGCYTKPIYHHHTGHHSYGDTSGCYSECGSTDFFESGGYWYCSKCFTAIQPVEQGRPSRCESPKLTCGKSESTIEGYDLGCGRKEGEIESATIEFK